MRRVICRQDNKQWIWLALDVITREIVGVYIGERRATGLWNSLPPVYRQCALLYRFLVSLQQYFPQSRHKAVDKETGKTSYIERFNNTMRKEYPV